MLNDNTTTPPTAEELAAWERLAASLIDSADVMRAVGFVDVPVNTGVLNSAALAMGRLLAALKAERGRVDALANAAEAYLDGAPAIAPQTDADYWRALRAADERRIALRKAIEAARATNTTTDHPRQAGEDQ